MQIKKLVFYFINTSFLIVGTKSTLFCHFRTFILHQPHIVLFGDVHPYSANYREIDHLTDLLKKISTKERPCTFLVEDYFEVIHKKLKSLAPDDLKRGFLLGLIQRINALRPDLSTVCIERANIIGRALQYPCYYKSTPLFWGLVPTKIKHEGAVAEGLEENGYNIRFLDLINEAKKLQQDLDARRSSVSFGPDVQEFIHSMQVKIDEQLEILGQILLGSYIKETESILESSIRYWILEKIYKYKTKVPEIVQVSHELETFINDYKRGMSKEEWRRRTEELIDRCSQISKVTKLPIKEEPSLSVKLTTTLTALPFIKSWFKRAPVEEPMPVQQDQVATWPAIPFDNPMKRLHDCMSQLRLLVIDSHATLDVLEHKDRDVVLIAGDDHVENITIYLSQLGFLQIDKKVRDISLNQMPLDLGKLPI